MLGLGLGVKTDALCLTLSADEAARQPARQRQLNVLCWGQELGTLLRRGEAPPKAEAQPLLVGNSKYALRGGMNDDKVIRSVYAKAANLLSRGEMELALCIPNYENITGTPLNPDTSKDLLDAMDFVSAVALARTVKPIADRRRTNPTSRTLPPTDQGTLRRLGGLPRRVLNSLNDAADALQKEHTHLMERECRELHKDLMTLASFLPTANV